MNYNHQAGYENFNQNWTNFIRIAEAIISNNCVYIITINRKLQPSI